MKDDFNILFFSSVIVSRSVNFYSRYLIKLQITTKKLVNEMDLTEGLKVCVGNWGYLSEGYPRTAWITLPKTDEEIQNFLTDNGLLDVEHEEIYIADYEDIPFECNKLFNDYTKLEDLNLFAKECSLLDEMDLDSIAAYLSNNVPDNFTGLLNVVYQATEYNLPFRPLDYHHGTPLQNFGWTMADLHPELHRLLESNTHIEQAFDYEAYAKSLLESDYMLSNDCFAYISDIDLSIETLYSREELNEIFSSDKPTLSKVNELIFDNHLTAKDISYDPNHFYPEAVFYNAKNNLAISFSDDDSSIEPGIYDQNVVVGHPNLDKLLNNPKISSIAPCYRDNALFSEALRFSFDEGLKASYENESEWQSLIEKVKNSPEFEEVSLRLSMVDGIKKFNLEQKIEKTPTQQETDFRPMSLSDKSREISLPENHRDTHGGHDDPDGR